MDSTAEQPTIWNTYSEVPTTGYKSSLLVGARNSNQTSLNAWNNREAHPVAWLHSAFRWQLHKLLPQAYADAAGIPRTTVTLLETPGTQIDNKYHTTLHRVVRFWKERGEGLPEGEVAPKVLPGLEKFLDAVNAHTALAVNRLLMRERILQGPEVFDEKTGINRHTLQRRVKEDRLFSFNELVGHMQKLHRPESKRDEKLWKSDQIERARMAFVADNVARGWKPEIALLRAAVEFAELDFTTEGLHEQGELSRSASSALIANRYVSRDMLAPLLAKLRGKLPPADIAMIFDGWPTEIESIERPAFATRIRGNMEALHLGAGDMTEAFGIEMEGDQQPSDFLRNALERGPMRSMPPAALLYVSAPTAEAANDDALGAIHEELTGRAGMAFRQANARLHAALQMYGLEADQVFTGDVLEQFRLLRAGNESSLSEEEAMTRIRRVGLRTKVLPPLERYVDARAPDTLEDTLRLLAASRKGGFNTLADAGHTSTETLQEVVSGTTMVPPVLLQDVFKAQGSSIPAAVETQMHLRYSEWLRGKDSPRAIGAAIHAIMGRTHRFPKTFARDRSLGWPGGSFAARLRRASTEGVMEPDHLQDFLQAVGIGAESPCGVLLRRLRMNKSPAEVLPGWIKWLHDEGHHNDLRSLHMLILSLDDTEPDEPEQASGLSGEKKLTAILRKKFATEAWLAGKKADPLTEPEDTLMLSAALLVPGITRAELLACKEQFGVSSAPAAAPQEQKNLIREVPRTDDLIALIPRHIDLHPRLRQYDGAVCLHLQGVIRAAGGGVTCEKLRQELLTKLSTLGSREQRIAALAEQE